MSELMNANASANFLRARLLATVCGLALFVSATVATKTRAEDADRPTIWIELGGQLERMSNGESIFDPPFLARFDHLNLDPVLPVQDPLRYSFGGEGKLTFEPAGTDWVLSVSARYGRSNGQKSSKQQLPEKTFPGQFGTGHQRTPYHLNALTTSNESHAIVDFEVGKDVGLGMFSPKGESTVSLGVRFAQFTSRKKGNLNGLPDFYHHGINAKYTPVITTHRNYFGTFEAERSFRGVGPSLSWASSQPLFGNTNSSEISLDWGINAAVLFGRQKVKGQTDTVGKHYATYFKEGPFGTAIAHYSGIASSYHHHTDINRAKSVIVPNVGGFAGLSLRFPNAKVSLGYRANFFFGAMDGGIDSRKTYDRNFYGPLATISIGLGG